MNVKQAKVKDDAVANQIAFLALRELSSCKYLYDFLVTGAIAGAVTRHRIKATDEDRAEALSLVHKALPEIGFTRMTELEIEPDIESELLTQG